MGWTLSTHLDLTQQEDMKKWMASLREAVACEPLGCALDDATRIQPDYMGFLDKSNPQGERWKRRVFLLKGRFLHYYKNTKVMAGPKPRRLVCLHLNARHVQFGDPLGSIDLTSYTVEVDNERVRLSLALRNTSTLI